MNHNELPNSFDQGIFISKTIEWIIFHNLKQGNFKETMSIIFPYIEKAYLQGKVSDYFFETYDYYLHYYKGYQYFGTMGDSVPTEDAKNLLIRRKKYGL